MPGVPSVQGTPQPDGRRRRSSTGSSVAKRYKTISICLDVTSEGTRRGYHVHLHNAASILEQLASGSLDEKLSDIERINFMECGSKFIPASLDDDEELGTNDDSLDVARMSHVLGALVEKLPSIKMISVERIMADQTYCKATALGQFLAKLPATTEIKARVELNEPTDKMRKQPKFPESDYIIYDNIYSIKIIAGKRRDLLASFPGHDNMPEKLEKFDFTDKHNQKMVFDDAFDVCFQLRKVALKTNYAMTQWLPDTVTKLTLCDLANHHEIKASLSSHHHEPRSYQSITWLAIDLHSADTTSLNGSRFPNLQVAWVTVHKHNATIVNLCAARCLERSLTLQQLFLAKSADPMSILPQCASSVRLLNLGLLDYTISDPIYATSMARQYWSVETIEMSIYHWSTDVMIAFCCARPNIVFTAKIGSDAAAQSRVKEELRVHAAGNCVCKTALSDDFEMLKIWVESGEALHEDDTAEIRQFVDTTIAVCREFVKDHKTMAHRKR